MTTASASFSCSCTGLIEYLLNATNASVLQKSESDHEVLLKAQQLLMTSCLTPSTSQYSWCTRSWYLGGHLCVPRIDCPATPAPCTCLYQLACSHLWALGLAWNSHPDSPSLASSPLPGLDSNLTLSVRRFLLFLSKIAMVSSQPSPQHKLFLTLPKTSLVYIGDFLPTALPREGFLLVLFLAV